MLESAHMVKKREFEEWELQDAARLRELINAHLESQKITQAEFSANCGWSQGVIYQYTKPERALGLENVVIFARTLNVAVDQISLTLANRIRELNSFVIHENGYMPKSKEAEIAARIVDGMGSPTQRDKAVKIVTTIAEPDGNHGSAPKRAAK
jgi:hypothetical protein